MLYGDEETVSVATGSSKAIHLAPSVASVITADDIKTIGANSLEDVLSTVPGVHVSLRSIYASNYSMRGVQTTSGPQILLLLNGYPFAETCSGTEISIQKVHIRNLKRVEIIRGPGSAVYGADAFSGVINVITNTNENIEDTQFGVSQLSRPHWQISLNTYHQDDTGIGTGIGDALDPEGNQYYLQNLFEVKYASDESKQEPWHHEIRFDYFHLKQESDYTIFPAGTVLPIDTEGNLNGGVAVGAVPGGIVFFSDGFKAIPGGEDKYYSTDFAAFYSGLNGHRFRFAFGYKKQAVSVYEKLNFGPGVIDSSQPLVDGTLMDITGTASIFLPDSDRKSYYLSVQNEWLIFKDWELTAGLRFDDYSDFW